MKSEKSRWRGCGFHCLLWYKKSIDKNRERCFSLFFFLFLSIDILSARFLSAWYCLPDSLPRHGFNPETSSRVTLASLGTVFQTGLSVLLRLRLFTVLFRLRLLRHVQNLSRITRMRRICSFTDFIFFLVLPIDIGFTTDCFCAYTALDSLQQEIIRDKNKSVISV